MSISFQVVFLVSVVLTCFHVFQVFKDCAIWFFRFCSFETSFYVVMGLVRIVVVCVFLFQTVWVVHAVTCGFRSLSVCCVWLSLVFSSFLFVFCRSEVILVFQTLHSVVLRFFGLFSVA